jgi:hypothetical protein
MNRTHSIRCGHDGVRVTVVFSPKPSLLPSLSQTLLVPSMGMLLMLTPPSPRLRMRNKDILKGWFSHGFAVTYYEIPGRFDPSAAKIDSFYSMIWGSLEDPRWRFVAGGSQLSKGATKVSEQIFIFRIRSLSPFPCQIPLSFSITWPVFCCSPFF